MSNLELNEPTPKFKEFYGQINKEMSNILSEGRVPLSTSGLIKKRLETLTSSEEVRKAWWNNYFNTGEGLLYNPNGNIKIVLDYKPIYELLPQNKLSKDTLFPDELYEKLEGKEFTRDELKNITGKQLSKNEAKNNPIWKALARDELLLNEYVDAVFSQIKPTYRKSKKPVNIYEVNESMGIYLAKQPKSLTPRLWNICGLNSDFVANGDFDPRFHVRLIGVR